MGQRITRRRVLEVGIGAGVAALAAVAFVGAADPPQVTSVRASQPNLARGNRFTVTVSITGDVHAAAITYATPRGGALTQSLHPTYGTNYEASFVILNGAPVGVYQVNSIIVRDSTNQVTLRATTADPNFADLVRDASVTVTTDGNPASSGQQPGTSDQSPAAALVPIATASGNTAASPSSAPTMNGALAFVSTSVSQNLLAYGNAFTARVVARGPADTVRVTYAYPGGDTTHTLGFDYTSGDESHYETTYTVTGDLPLGHYTISHLYAEGSDGSVLDLALPPDDPLIAGSSVDVTTDGNPAYVGQQGGSGPQAAAMGGLAVLPAVTPTPTPPPTPTLTPAVTPAANPIRVTGVTLSMPSVRPGASFTVATRIEDSAGNIVGQPVVSFSDGSHELFAFLSRTAAGMYRGTVTVSQYYPEGTYAFSRLYAYDDAGNVLELRQPDTGMFHSDIMVHR